MANLDLNKFIETFKLLPKNHKIGALVTTPRTIELITECIPESVNKSENSVSLFHIGLISLVPCNDLDNDDVLMFKNLTDANDFVKLLDSAKKLGISAKQYVELVKDHLKEGTQDNGVS